MISNLKYEFIIPKIKKEDVQVCDLGLVDSGLPTASMFAPHGLNMLGVDINQIVVENLNQGEIDIEEPGLTIVVTAAVTTGHLQISTGPDLCDMFLVAVPTLSTSYEIMVNQY